MADKQFSESQRQLIALLLMEAWVRIRDDSEMKEQTEELVDTLRMTQGVDTVLISRKP